MQVKVGIWKMRRGTKFSSQSTSTEGSIDTYNLGKPTRMNSNKEVKHYIGCMNQNEAKD